MGERWKVVEYLAAVYHCCALERRVLEVIYRLSMGGSADRLLMSYDIQVRAGACEDDEQMDAFHYFDGPKEVHETAEVYLLPT